MEIDNNKTYFSRIQAKAYINIQNNDGETALHWGLYKFNF